MARIIAALLLLLPSGFALVSLTTAPGSLFAQSPGDTPTAQDEGKDDQTGRADQDKKTDDAAKPPRHPRPISYADVRKQILDLYRKVISYQSTKTYDEICAARCLPLVKLKLEKAYMLLDLYRQSDYRDELMLKDLGAAKKLIGKLGEKMDPLKGQVGFVERAYISNNDLSTQPYVLWIPASYSAVGRTDGEGPPIRVDSGKSPAKKYPLIVFLHGYAMDLNKVNWVDMMFSDDLKGIAEKEGYIVLLPFGRSNTEFMGIGEADVLKAIELVKRDYEIDEDKVFLTGASMGGSGVYTITCHYPHLFAGLMVIAGRCDYYMWQKLDKHAVPKFKQIQIDLDYAVTLARSLRNCPSYIFHGDVDELVSPAQSRRMHRLLKSYGAPTRLKIIKGGDHWIWGDVFLDPAFTEWLNETKRDPNPRVVEYWTYSMKYNKAYWVTIRQMLHWGERAEIRAEVKEDNHIEVKTTNIVQLDLNLKSLITADKEVFLKINGKSETIPPTALKDGRLSIEVGPKRCKPSEITEAAKAISRFKTSALKKTPSLSGPVREAYLSRFLFVYGTGDATDGSAANSSDKAVTEQAAREWIKFSAGSRQIKADTDVSANDIRTSDLILFGPPQTNSILKKIVRKLPIKIRKDYYVVGRRKFFKKKSSLLMIYPNPLNPQKYVVINCGTLWGKKLSINHKLDMVPDFIIFTDDVAEDDTNKYLCAGYFNQFWELDDTLTWFADE